MNADKFHLGRSINDSTDVDLDPRLLTKHVVVLGASGSGKTCLSKVLVEDAVRFGIPVIAIDSQGDLASLGLTGEGAPDGIAADYWNKVDLTLWTHKIGGLHENDFILAAKVNRLLEDDPDTTSAG